MATKGEWGVKMTRKRARQEARVSLRSLNRVVTRQVDRRNGQAGGSDVVGIPASRVRSPVHEIMQNFMIIYDGNSYMMVLSALVNDVYNACLKLFGVLPN